MFVERKVCDDVTMIAHIYTVMSYINTPPIHHHHHQQQQQQLLLSVHPPTHHHTTKHTCITRFISGLPTFSLSSLDNLTPNLSNMGNNLSLLSFMHASMTVLMGSYTNWQKPRLQVPDPVSFFVHFFVAGSKKLSPHRRSIIFFSSTPNFLA